MNDAVKAVVTESLEEVGGTHPRHAYEASVDFFTEADNITESVNIRVEGDDIEAVTRATLRIVAYISGSRSGGGAS